MSAMNVVDVKSDTKDSKDSTGEKSNASQMTPEDRLWVELLKTLDKLEKGVEGDLSALGRATRNINRFRKRLPPTTWARILHTIIPDNYRAEFADILRLFVTDLSAAETQLIATLAGVTEDEATAKRSSLDGDVFAALMALVTDKEQLAKVEIVRKQTELKKERLEREAKKGGKGIDGDVESDAKDTTAKASDAMDVDSDAKTSASTGKGEDGDVKVSLVPLRRRRAHQRRKFYPETYILLQLLLSLELLDRGEFGSARGHLERLIAFAKDQNRRTSDGLHSRLYQFWALAVSRDSESESKVGGQTWMLHFLLDNYQTACLQQNSAAQSVLMVLILAHYTSARQYSLAHKFCEKAEFPESSESPYFARYHFYLGQVDCVQLNYADSLFHLQQALRRAPQTGAYGFKLSATRWLIAVQLLMGDIPDRATFKPRFDGDNERNNLELNTELAPFLQLTECVKEGDLATYMTCLEVNGALLKKVGLSRILLRLRHNVIKTGLRKINASYSRISLADIAEKLALSGMENALNIVSKAIRDGVIDAKIDYAAKCVESVESGEMYSTSVPYGEYAQRIKFCLEIRNSAVKNLRYPPKEEGDEDEKARDKEEEDKQQATAEEIAEMIQKQFEDEED